MGIGASSCIGCRKKSGKYCVNDPRRARNECLGTTMSDFEMKDEELCVQYKMPCPLQSKEDDPIDGVVADDVDVAVPENNENEATGEKHMACHNHGPLPDGGIDGATEVPHPDLPKGVTCITCAATIMEKGQEQGMGEVILDEDIRKTTQETTKLEEDKDTVTENVGDGKCTDPEKDTVKSDPASGDKIARGSRWRRRYNALDKASPTAMKAE